MTFTVYKSSAGSGKTYTLVREYLKMVLQHPDEYKHVLAITFTNKAANEMKDRIISVLKQIGSIVNAQPNKKLAGLVSELMTETGLEMKALQINADRVLTSILHNYSEFSVSTIDSFIHRVIKSFAFDLNVPINFEVEMDTDAVLQQVIDIMISRAGSEEELTRFLIEFVRSKADEEKNWNIESDLLKIAKRLKNENDTEFLTQNKHLGLQDYLKINKTIQKFLREFENKIQSFGRQGAGLITNAGIPVEAFSHGKTGIANYFPSLSNGNFAKILPNKNIIKNIGADKWFSAKANAFQQVEILALKDELLGIYENILGLIDEEYQEYLLFSEIRKAIYPLAVLDKLSQVLEEFKSENNILLIAEFNQLISEIVLDEPIPFIYERVGEKYKHFLVDEFQDTSILQWQNLIPLIDNSLAAGYHNMIVGDAKQAIYRWRNGEVEQFVALPEIYKRKTGQLHFERENALQQHYNSKTLNANFRSSPEIVEFNNNFFSFARSYLSEKDNIIYDEVKQDVATKKQGGYIQLQFYADLENSVSFSEYNCIQVKNIIEEAINNKYELEDMAVLCNKNAQAGTIAAYLLENNIQVVSSESVLLCNSPRIRLIICVFALLVRPGNQLAALELKNLLIKMNMVADDLHTSSTYSVKSPGKKEEQSTEAPFTFLKHHGFDVNRNKLLSLPLYDLCELLVRTFHFQDETDPFIQFFLDVINEQERKTESDLKKFLEYWEKKKNSLSIVVPEGVNAVRIMTIHKSKGLEFPLVIYPFVSDNQGKSMDSVWVNPESDLVPDLKAALVGANNLIAESKYGAEVHREREKSLLDMINLMYVAFTRPTNQLYVISQFPKPTSKTISVSSLLIDYLKKIQTFQEGMYTYSFGQVPAIEKQTRKITTAFNMGNFISENWRKRAMISYQAPLNWDVEKPERRQEYGNLVHEILSEIIVADDLAKVLNTYVHNGVITSKEGNSLGDLIVEFISRPGVKPFFEENLSVKTESEIITPSGKLLRPDRLVWIDDMLYVIDFKTGVPTDKHKTQMLEYLNVIEQMDYPEPKGVLLYLNQKDPVMVN